jgi:hypothetical protein
MQPANTPHGEKQSRIPQKLIIGVRMDAVITKTSWVVSLSKLESVGILDTKRLLDIRAIHKLPNQALTEAPEADR